MLGNRAALTAQPPGLTADVIVMAHIRTGHAEWLCGGQCAGIIQPAAIAAQEHLLRYALAAKVKQVHPSIFLNVQLQEENHHLHVVFPREISPKICIGAYLMKTSTFLRFHKKLAQARGVAVPSC